MPKLELDTQKVYKMPPTISIVTIDSNILVISRDTANWLLLHNEQQLRIFHALNEGCNIASLFEKFPSDARQDILQVLIELEAKRFENIIVQYPQEHGMYLYLTEKCNQRCRHCYMYAGDGSIDSKELSTEEIGEILRKFAEYGGKVVTLTGGEATLRSDFVKIVYTAKELGLKICVLSNGLLWGDSLIGAVKDYVDEVQISIDGFDTESYKCVRGMDAFEQALDAVDRLVAAGVKITVAITPLLETLLPNQSQYIQFAKDLIGKYGQKDFLVKFNTELMEGRNVAPTEADNDLYRSAARKIKEACNPLSGEKGFALDHKNNTAFNNCGYGGLCISATGDVFFCSIIAKCAKQANIRTDSFEKIMEYSSKARAASDVSNLLPCCECTLKYLCGGGCRVKHFKDLVQTRIYDQKDKSLVGKYIRDTVCTEEDKNKIYQLMIAANELFYQ